MGMMFAVPEGCEDINVILSEDLEGTIAVDPDAHIQFDIIFGELSVVYVEFIQKAQAIMDSWRCNEDAYEFGHRYICENVVEHIAKHMKSGILMTTITLANNFVHAFFVSPNAYAVDTDWPLGDFKDKNMQKINETILSDPNYRYLFDNVSKYYETLSQEVSDVSRKLLRSK